MIEVSIRLLGLIALFWTNWIVALISLLALGFINPDDCPRGSIIRNTGLRITVELVASVLAVVGIWFFPLVDPANAHILAVVAGVATFVSMVQPFTREY
jgi:hypothetical protein